MTVRSAVRWAATHGAMRLAISARARAGNPDAEVLLDPAVREDVEARTETAMEPVLAAIGPDLPDLTRQLDAWSAAVVAGGAAPPDPYKRISG